MTDDSKTRRIPEPSLAQVWIDFDGTISQQDVLDELIQRYAVDDSWKEIERQWQEGQIGSYDCLKAEFDVIRIQDDELNRFLDTIEIDRGIFDLLKLLKEHKVPATIVSDGVDLFIQRILAINDIHDLPIRSNTIDRQADRLSLRCPHRDATCLTNAAHCKCASISQLGIPHRKNIYIGDGRSDLCPASRRDRAEIVFAKNSLARSLTQQQVDFFRYTQLSEVADALRAAWHKAG